MDFSSQTLKTQSPKNDTQKGKYSPKKCHKRLFVSDGLKCEIVPQTERIILLQTWNLENSTQVIRTTLMSPFLNCHFITKAAQQLIENVYVYVMQINQR